MYTQCPDCATVFRVTAEALRAAQGDVRCGVCSTSFNALENLSEQAFQPAPANEEPAPDDSMTVEELPGGENIELSAPVELAVVSDPAADSPEPEAPEDEQRAMEFHGSAEDLDRLFVVEEPALAQFDPAAVAAELSHASQPRDLDSTDEHPILVLDESDDEPEPEAEAEAEVDSEAEAEEGESIVLESAEPDPEPLPPAPLPPAPAPPPARKTPATGHTAPRILIPDEMRKRLAEEAQARASAAELFEETDDDLPGLLSQRWPWVAAVTILALSLILQVVHSQRDALLRSPSLGPLVAGTYDFFGLSVLAPTDLGSYELHQWGAASDPNETQRLMLRASIVNRASYAQPLPLLRLTLQDRYGSTLGQRDIGPADYLPGPGGGGLLEPGERADALIRIVDPGAEAVGYELDVCLPMGGGVRCATSFKTAGP